MSTLHRLCHFAYASLTSLDHLVTLVTHILAVLGLSGPILYHVTQNIILFRSHMIAQFLAAQLPDWSVLPAKMGLISQEAFRVRGTVKAISDVFTPNLN